MITTASLFYPFSVLSLIVLSSSLLTIAAVAPFLSFLVPNRASSTNDFLLTRDAYDTFPAEISDLTADLGIFICSCLLLFKISS